MYIREEGGQTLPAWLWFLWLFRSTQWVAGDLCLLPVKLCFCWNSGCFPSISLKMEFHSVNFHGLFSVKDNYPAAHAKIQQTVLQSFLNSYSCNSVLIVQTGWLRYCWSFITIWNGYYKMLNSIDKSQTLSFALELEWWEAKLLRQKCNVVSESSVWKCYLNWCWETIVLLSFICQFLAFLGIWGRLHQNFKMTFLFKATVMQSFISWS